MKNQILLTPGTLLDALDERIRTAWECGALRPIETEQEVLQDAGVRFLVQRASNLQRKEADRRRRVAQPEQRNKPANPFLPPEPELTVAGISATHLAVLNKFNVLDRHLLIVTKRFEHQETLLTNDDFRALFACMAQYDGLGFYNGGVPAGASQMHKHLQLVPLPLSPNGPSVPIETLLEGDGPHCPNVPFAHAFGRFSTDVGRSPMAAADEAQALYLDLIGLIGVTGLPEADGPRHSTAYNLLIANNWMLAVPRASEFFEGMSINALGFAGSLFVKNGDQLDLIRRETPMRVLQRVSGSLQDA